MSKILTATTATGLSVKVKKDFYSGLWNVVYDDTMQSKFAGPYKTRREAVQRMNELCGDGE